MLWGCAIPLNHTPPDFGKHANGDELSGGFSSCLLALHHGGLDVEKYSIYPRRLPVLVRKIGLGRAQGQDQLREAAGGDFAVPLLQFDADSTAAQVERGA